MLSGAATDALFFQLASRQQRYTFKGVYGIYSIGCIMIGLSSWLVVRKSGCHLGILGH
jgi:hypothetical protein